MSTTLRQERASISLPPVWASPSDGAHNSLHVEVADAARYRAISGEWRDLVRRAAEPNVFMEPALVTAAADSGADIRVLLTWRDDDDCSKPVLVGAWALRVGSPATGAPFKVFTSAGKYAFLGNPVVDRAHLPSALKRMLDTIGRAPDLPKTILLRQVATDGLTITALREHVRERGGRVRMLEGWQRPKLASPLSGEDYIKQALSSGSRKKLRQHRNRLEKQGQVAFVVQTAAHEVTAGFEQFLDLEAAGWKGQSSTAIACRANDLQFARTFISSLARESLAWLVMLTLDGRPIAIQVMLRSGTAAFTWKTAFDEHYADFSPGVLLLQEITNRMLADSQIAYVDSCSHAEQGYMADMWQERQAVADICFDIRPGNPLAFQAVVALENAHLRARLLWRRIKPTFASGAAKGHHHRRRGLDGANCGPAQAPKSRRPAAFGRSNRLAARSARALARSSDQPP